MCALGRTGGLGILRRMPGKRDRESPQSKPARRRPIRRGNPELPTLCRTGKHSPDRPEPLVLTPAVAEFCRDGLRCQSGIQTGAKGYVEPGSKGPNWAPATRRAAEVREKGGPEPPTLPGPPHSVLC
jgi:hypothetical protein